jgi:hypothetical protein
VGTQIDLINGQLNSIVHVDLGSPKGVPAYVPSQPGQAVVSYIGGAALQRQDSPSRVPSGYVTAGKPTVAIAIDVSSIYTAGGVALVPIVLQYTVSARELLSLFEEETARAILTDPVRQSPRIFERFSIHKETAGAYEMVNLVPGLISPYAALGDGILRLAGGGQLTIGIHFLAVDDAGWPQVDGQHLIVPDGVRDGTVRDPAWLLMTNAAPSPVTPTPSPSPSPNPNPGSGPSQKSGGGCNGGLGIVVLALGISFLARQRVR